MPNETRHVIDVARESPWLFYSVIAAGLLVLFIGIVFIYDLCTRCKTQRTLVEDGGPPTSPDHNHIYAITITIDEASPTFDIKGSVLRIDFLDYMNQFLTTLVLPTAVFKIKQRKSLLDGAGGSAIGTPSSNTKQSQQQQQQHQQTKAPTRTLTQRSLATLMDIWADMPKSKTITVFVNRRNSLTNLRAVRLSHDCYLTDAALSLRQIVIKEQGQQFDFKLELTGKPIVAKHPCPPSGFQVIPLVKSVSERQVDGGNSRCFWCCDCSN